MTSTNDRFTGSFNNDRTVIQCGEVGCVGAVRLAEPRDAS
jgi:hypothetical protein